MFIVKMLLNRHGQSEELCNKLIGAPFSHVLNVGQSQACAKAPKVLQRPSPGVPHTGGRH